MAEYLYEGMFLLDSAQFAADHEGTAKQVLDILENAGAQIDAHRPWQDGRLAYEIEGHKKGLHYLVLFRMDGSALAGVTRQCKLSDTVVRQLILKHPAVLYEALVESLSGHEAIQEGGTEEVADSDDSDADEEVAVDAIEEAEVASEG